MAACVQALTNIKATLQLRAEVEELHKELAVHHGRPLERMRVVVLCPAIVVTDLLTSGEEATGGAVKARVTCEEDNAVCLLRTL